MRFSCSGAMHFDSCRRDSSQMLQTLLVAEAVRKPGGRIVSQARTCDAAQSFDAVLLSAACLDGSAAETLEADQPIFKLW